MFVVPCILVILVI